MRFEIAGLKVDYHNAPDLNEKVRKELLAAQAHRKSLNQECQELRKREKTLRRFLGDGPVSADKGNSGGLHE